MGTKLTLSVNQSVIEDAKQYAKSTGKSLSSIVEEYLKSLSTKGTLDKKAASLQIVRELKGAVKLPDDFSSYEEVLQDALIDKYIDQ